MAELRNYFPPRDCRAGCEFSRENQPPVDTLMFVRLQNIWLYKVNQSKYIVLFIQLFTTRSNSDGICEGKEPKEHNTKWKKDRNVGNGETAVETYREKKLKRF